MEPGRFHLFLLFVASDRARRENVPRHILFYGFCSRHLFIYGVQITGIPL